MATNQRIAYGEALVQLGKENPDIVVLEADLGKSTMTHMFRSEFPERCFEMGIAEQNMASTAAGLACAGKIPFINTFAVFAVGRTYDQLRQTIAIGELNVNICGSSAGLSDFGDGATHQAVEDMALMRAVPNMTVICPADANETLNAMKQLPGIDGPAYIRINRNDYDNVTAENEPFELGVPKVLREGSDIAVFACGVMVGHALQAAEALAGQVSVRVVNVSTLKPLNGARIAQLAEGCAGVVTAEEHSVIGGLGSAVAQALRGAPKPLEHVAIMDEFGCSAHSYKELMAHYGLMPADIEKAVRKLAGK